MDIKWKFGQRMKDLRIIKGYSQERLSYKAGLDRTYVNSIENGKRNVSIKNIIKIVNALDISLSDFFNSKKFM